MHAAFLAVQYDSSDTDLLRRCQAMVNGLCSDYFMMPSLEVGCLLHLLLKVVKVAVFHISLSVKERKTSTNG